jgi:hypothetical protein
MFNSLVCRRAWIALGCLALLVGCSEDEGSASGTDVASDGVGIDAAVKADLSAPISSLPTSVNFRGRVSLAVDPVIAIPDGVWRAQTGRYARPPATRIAQTGGSVVRSSVRLVIRSTSASVSWHGSVILAKTRLIVPRPVQTVRINASLTRP